MKNELTKLPDSSNPTPGWLITFLRENKNRTQQKKVNNLLKNKEGIIWSRKSDDIKEKSKYENRDVTSDVVLAIIFGQISNAHAADHVVRNPRGRVPPRAGLNEIAAHYGRRLTSFIYDKELS